MRRWLPGRPWSPKGRTPWKYRDFHKGYVRAEEKEKARRFVEAYFKDPLEADKVLDMLGLL